MPSLLHGGRLSLVCLQIGRCHPGRTWCWSQLFKFSSDARITSRCQLLLLGRCISDISPHPGRRRKRESAPQAFLRGRTGSYVLCSGFYWGVFLQVSPQIRGYGTWPTNPKRQGEVPQGVPGQARPCEICPVRPSSYHLELQSCWSNMEETWKFARQLCSQMQDRFCCLLVIEVWLKRVWHASCT